MRLTFLLISALCGAFSETATQAEKVQHWITYPSSVTQQSNRWIQLKAEVNYDDAVTNAPIAVVMHGYSMSSTVAGVRPNAQRLRDAGFFAVSVTMRGREGSEGTRDSGGVEIYDIYDAVEAVKLRYAAWVNPTNIHITGYSGGGGNVLAALTRFPDYFCLGAAFFGMSDYGFDPIHGWYHCGANVGGIRTNQLDADIGDANSTWPVVRDRYQARAAWLAASNRPCCEIHLFVNWNEPICPPINSIRFYTNATAARLPNDPPRVQLHLGTNGCYQDFNRNGLRESAELQWWPHGEVNADQQAAAESWYLPRLKLGRISAPRLADHGVRIVTGWVRSQPFELWLGDGQNAVAQLTYALTPAKQEFTLKLLSQVRTVTGRLSVNTRDFSRGPLNVYLNGVLVGAAVRGETYLHSGLRDGDTIAIVAEP